MKDKKRYMIFNGSYIDSVSASEVLTYEEVEHRGFSTEWSEPTFEEWAEVAEKWDILYCSGGYECIIYLGDEE